MVIKTKQLGIALQWDGARPFAEEEDDTLAEGWAQCTHEMGVCHNSAQSAEHSAQCTVDTVHRSDGECWVYGTRLQGGLLLPHCLDHTVTSHNHMLALLFCQR